eukprot:CAMPEP_0201491470 /NCGR_PEP_ID=MMETSP0151_2-20130828/29967_1 /ASSEMBLY_ACC=CAM_ASM_000257 /TAXON_ID=200890 /ORGANISM="Paramoeba atlantica, Strain 621/1 / CCAP 1560/9" /LENGTH=345 /DNA_ID=CAMNT_0047877839 /DNA_START=79 /DNA_END=1112 /DNA_ORIENTATION=-
MHHSFLVFFFFLVSSSSLLSSSSSHKSARKKAIIHIGPRATGSTSFQMSLNKASIQEQLKKHGYWVAMDHIKSGGLFVQTLLSVNHLEAKEDMVNLPKYYEIVNTIQQKETSFIISSEEFVELSPVGINLLAELLVDYDVSIVAVHRDSTDHLRSLWAAANRESRAPVPFFHWANEMGPSLTSLNISEVLDRYAQVFGKSSIELISFEGSFRAANPFSIFLKDVLHLPMRQFDVTFGKTNESPSSFYIDFVSAMSTYSSPRNSCVLPWELERKIDLKQAVSKFPQACNDLKAWKLLWSMNQEDLFEKYGQPYRYPKLMPQTHLCSLDLIATIASAETRKMFTDFA